jgi:hypothetical protein
MYSKTYLELLTHPKLVYKCQYSLIMIINRRFDSVICNNNGDLYKLFKIPLKPSTDKFKCIYVVCYTSVLTDSLEKQLNISIARSKDYLDFVNIEWNSHLSLDKELLNTKAAQKVKYIKNIIKEANNNSM